MSKQKLMLVLGLLVMVALVAACAGAETPAATEEPAAPAEAATEAPAEPAEAPAEAEVVEGYECDDPLGCVEVAEGDPIKVASALVISGPNAALGLDTQYGVEIALDWRGEVLGRSLELQAEDGGCSAEGGQTAATKIAANEEVIGVIGHTCSSSCTPAAPIYDAAGLVMISGSCTAPSLTAADLHVPAFMRTAHNDSVQGKVAAEYAYNVLGARKAATIHDGSPYAEQLQAVFADTFVGLGGEVTAQEAVNVGDTDMRPLLTSIATGGPDLLFYPIFIAEGGFITSQSKDVAGLESVTLMGADGLQSPDFVEAAGGAAEGMYLTGPDLSFENDLYATFLETYLDKYGSDPVAPYHAHAFDATNMILDAVEAVAIESDGTLYIPRQALRDALYATSNFDGITGNLNCDENGDCADPKISVVQVQDSEFVRVFPEAEGAMEEGGEEMAAGTMMKDDGLMVVSAGNCEYGGKVLSIEAVDEKTVQFNLCKSDPAFLAKAAFTPFAIQPSEWIEETGGTGQILEQPVGTGAYYLDSWNRGDSLVYKRFDDYWGEPAIAETLVFRWGTESAARLLELQSGTVDYITNLAADDIETVEADPNLQVVPLPAPNIFYIAMTNTFEPFGDVNVRKAVAMGIDRARIVDNFYPAGSEVASHFTPCNIPGGCEGEAWYDFDAEAAKAMLADAGYPDGFQTTIYFRDVFRDYLPEPSVMAVELQTQLKENLGIDADVVVMESGEFIDESTNGRLDGIYLLGWTGDYPHPTNFLDFHFSAQNPQFGDPHAAIYEPLEAASQLAKPEDTLELYGEANDAIKELAPMVPVVHSAVSYAARAGLEGVNNPPFGAPIMRLIDPGTDTLIFMKNAEPISLFCADETDGESLDSCQQALEGLYRYNTEGVAEPALATECVANDDLTVWTCSLRDGVKFHDGSDLDANDVVASWAAGIDASNPNHVGNTGSWEYYSYLWDGLMNAE